MQTDDEMDLGSDVRGAWRNVAKRAAKAAAKAAATNTNGADAGVAVARALLPYVAPQGSKACRKLSHAMLAAVAGFPDAACPPLLVPLAAAAAAQLSAKARASSPLSDAAVCAAAVTALAEAVVASPSDCLPALLAPAEMKTESREVAKAVEAAAERVSVLVLTRALALKGKKAAAAAAAIAEAAWSVTADAVADSARSPLECAEDVAGGPAWSDGADPFFLPVLGGPQPAGGAERPATLSLLSLH